MSDSNGLPLIDLRSDTVTKPTAAMRQAMFEAEVGDDVFGEDPTIAKLERTAAERTGKEAALFVSSGTMANLVSLLSQTTAGDELLVGDRAHIVRAEAGGVSRLGGVLATTLPNQPDGGFDPALIPNAVRPNDMHQPRTTLLALENTHNFCGGAVVSLERTQEIADTAHELGLRVHLDGARIFNAAVACQPERRRARRSRRQRHLLSLQGTRRARRLADLRRRSVHPASPPHAQAGRRRHAPGRHPRRRRTRRTR